MKWIMVANSNDCRIYQYDRHMKHFSLVDEINHPENKLKTYDLISDGPGHYKSGANNRGSFAPETDYLDCAIDRFAREMAIRLNKGRNQKAYDDLTLLMPPAMEGLLNKHLNKNIFSSIHHVIQKNLMHLSEHELKKYIWNFLKKDISVH